MNASGHKANLIHFKTPFQERDVTEIKNKESGQEQYLHTCSIKESVFGTFENFERRTAFKEETNGSEKLEINMNYDVLIVGAGLTGSILADLYARKLGKKVLVLEKKNHFGGQFFDYVNKHGIRIQKYGYSTFQTSNDFIFQYLNELVQDWVPYKSHEMAYLNEKFVPFPLNIHSANILSGEFAKGIKNPDDMMVWTEEYSATFSSIIKEFIEKHNFGSSDTIPEPLKPFLNIKQDYDNYLFKKKHQYLPKHGFSSIFDVIYANPNIELKLNTDILAKENKDLITNTEFKNKFTKIIYTEAIDKLFNYEKGKLQWNSKQFKFLKINKHQYFPTSIIHFPNKKEFKKITRAIEYKLLPYGKKRSDFPVTTVVGEMVVDKQIDGYEYLPNLEYPERQSRILEDYKKMAKDNQIELIGKFAANKHFTFDETIEHVFSEFEKISGENLQDLIVGKLPEKQKKKKLTFALCVCKGDFTWTVEAQKFFSERYDVEFHMINKCGKNFNKFFKKYPEMRNHMIIDNTANAGRDLHCVIGYIQRYHNYHFDDGLLFLSQEHLHSGKFFFVDKRVKERVRDNLFVDAFRAFEEDAKILPSLNLRDRKYHYLGTGAIARNDDVVIGKIGKGVSIDEVTKFYADCAKDFDDKFEDEEKYAKKTKPLKNSKIAGSRNGEGIFSSYLVLDSVARMSNLMNYMTCGLTDNSKMPGFGYFCEGTMSSVFNGLFRDYKHEGARPNQIFNNNALYCLRHNTLDNPDDPISYDVNNCPYEVSNFCKYYLLPIPLCGVRLTVDYDASCVQ